MQIRQGIECLWGMSVNANEEMLVMLVLILVALMLILMLLNLNTGYADTDADLCIRIMSSCCMIQPGVINTRYDLYTVNMYIYQHDTVNANGMPFYSGSWGK